MNHRAKGARLEYKVRDKLIEDGFIVTKSSNSQFPDSVAVRKVGGFSIVLYVECKTNKYLSIAEKREFIRIKDKTAATCVVAFPKKENGRVRIVLEEFKPNPSLLIAPPGHDDPVPLPKGIVMTKYGRAQE